MKRTLFLMLCVSVALGALADGFNKYFTDNTLRVDFGLKEAGEGTGLWVEDMRIVPGWHGRKVNLEKMYMPNNMELNMIDKASGDTIYRTSMFHTFGYGPDGEDIKSYNVFRMPLPKKDVEIEIVYLSSHRDTLLSTRQELTKKQLKKGVRRVSKKQMEANLPDMKVLNKSTHPSPVKIAFISEGFTADEMAKYDTLAQQLVDSLLSHEGFGMNKDRLEITSVRIPSQESGVTHLSTSDIKNTALKSEFGAFETARLLTIPDARRLADVLEGVPYDHVLALANTDEYGGSGCFHNYCIGHTGNWGVQVLIHEFGHHFIGLGDEYAEDDGGWEFTGDMEPFEPNITTLVDFSNKWQNLIDEGKAGLIEGAGYVSKGMWRGCENCLMRTVWQYRFCPVCTQAIDRCIKFHTEE